MTFPNYTVTKRRFQTAALTHTVTLPNTSNGDLLLMKVGSLTNDGVLMQWLDDKRIVHLYNIPWVRAGFNMVQWNAIGIGGNHNMSNYPNSERYEDWWAMDDLEVWNGIPAGRGLI